VGDGQPDGPGAWLDANQWWDGAANQTWVSGSDANFGNGGVGGAVTLASPTSVGLLTFNSFTGTYTLGTAANTITLSAGLTMNSGEGATTIISPITLGGAQSWTNNSSGLLTVGTGAVTNGGFLLTVGGSGNTTVSSVISGAGGLTKAGSGTLYLLPGGNANGPNPNTFTGGTTLTAGTLRTGSVGSNAFGTGSLTITGGTISIGGNNIHTLNNSAYNINGSFSAVNSGGHTLNFSTGPVALGASPTISVGNGLTFNINTPIGDGVNDYGLTKDGAGTMGLDSAASTYTGKTVVLAGTLRALMMANVGVPSSLGAPTGANSVIDMYNGTSLRTAQTNSTTNRVINLAGAGPGTVTIFIQDNDRFLTLNSAITATGTGAKTLALSVNGDRPGMTLNAGIPDIQDSSPLSLNATVAGNDQAAGAGRGINLNGVNTFTGPITLNAGAGRLTIGGAGQLGSGTYANTITMTGGEFYYNSSATQTLSGVISGTGKLAVNAGSLTLSNANIYTGATSISGGTLSLTGSLMDSSVSTSSTGIINQSAAGVIAGAAATFGQGSAATSILSGTNTYGGATSVTAGRLLVNGSLAAGSAVTVSGGVLGGSGTVGGAVTVSSAGGINLADGAVGTLTLGSTLGITGAAAANNLFFDLGNTTGTSDMLSVADTTSITTTGAAVITLNQLGQTAGRTATTYTLIGGAGTLDAANFAKFSLATTAAFGQTYSLVHDSGTDNGNLQVTAANVTAATLAAFWAGGGDNWSTTTNWRASLAGNDAVAGAPDYQTNVTFSTTTPVPANLTTNVLDVDFNINSLTFTNASGNVTIGGTKMLTIEAAAVNSNTLGNGINSAKTTGTNTISAKVGLAGSQTWTVATGGTLAVSGAISDFGAGNSLTKAGGGTLTLSGTNTFSGGISVSGGALHPKTVGSLGAAGNTVTFTGNSDFGDNSTNIDLTQNFTINNGVTVAWGLGSNNTDRIVSGILSGSGKLAIGGTKGVKFTNTGNTFTGPITMGGGIYAGRLYVNSIGDASGAGTIQIGSASGYGAGTFQYDSGAVAPLVLNYRQIDVASPSGSANLVNNAATANTITVNTDLLSTVGGTKTLVLNGTNTGNNLIAGKIVDGASGTVALSKQGTGTWIVSGANTYSRGTTITAGTLYANAAGTLSTGNVTVTGGTLVIGVADVMADTAALSLASATTKNITMNFNDTVGLLFLGGLQQPNNTYTSSGLGSAWMSGSGILTVGSAATQPLYWDLNGTDPNACVGGGNTAAGTWDGATENWNAVANGTGAPTAWSQGRTAAFAAGTDATGTYTVAVDGTRDIGGLTFEEGNVTLSGGTALRMTANSLAYVNTGRTATVAMPISDDGTARALTKSGAGTLVLSGANAYTGATIVSQGTLTLSHANAIGGASGSLIVQGGGVVADTTVNLSSLTFTGADNTNVSGGTLAFGTGGTINQTVINQQHTITSAITGSPTVNIAFNGNKSYPGGVAVYQGLTFAPTSGTVTLGIANVPPLNAGGDKAGLWLGGTTTGNSVEAVRWSPGADNHYGSLWKKDAGTWTVGNVDIGTLVIDGGTLVANGTLRWYYQGMHVFSGAALHYNNAGAVYSSGFNLNGGSFLDNSSGAAITISTYNPPQAWNGDWTFIGSQGANSNLYLGNGAVALGAANRQVTVQNAATTLTVGGVISSTGAFGLTKAGPGALRLTGTSTYTGATTINAGTLTIASGNINSTSGVNIGAGNFNYNSATALSKGITFTGTGGTLSGTGTIGTAVTVTAGNIIAPGNSAGTLTVASNLAMASGSTYVWQLDNTDTADKVVVTGNLTLTSGWTIKLMSDNGGTQGTRAYDLFSYGSLSGAFTVPTIDPTGDWTTASIADDPVGKRIYLTFAKPGDTNGDFVVDAADYIAIKTNFGLTGIGATLAKGNVTGAMGEAGTVDWADLQLLMANFGTRSVGGAPATPEPATLGLLAIGALAVIRRRRRS